MRVREALADCEARLAAAGKTEPRTDARRLLGHILSVESADIISRSGEQVPPELLKALHDAIDRRICGEPVSRIIGVRHFRDLELRVTRDVLDPRPETELLVERALAWAPSGAFRFADIGTGSGAIAIAMLRERKDARSIVCDISPAALDQAVANARRAGVADRVEPVISDFLACVPGGMDVIVSNPPYIETGAIPSLAAEVRDHDPHLALDGGPDGLDAYRAILRDAPARLRPGGSLHLEIGAGQADDVAALARHGGFKVKEIANDLGGVARVVTAVFPA